MARALIVIDVQNDYFPGGTMELVGMNESAEKCKILIEYFRKQQSPIFHIQHLGGKTATFFVPGTQGCEIHSSVKPLDDELLVTKNFPNAFRNTNLHEQLQSANINEVVICGAMTHMCIDTSTRAAFDLGYSCQVISDACATRDLDFKGHKVSADDVQAEIGRAHV